MMLDRIDPCPVIHYQIDHAHLLHRGMFKSYPQNSPQIREWGQHFHEIVSSLTTIHLKYNDSELEAYHEEEEEDDEFFDDDEEDYVEDDYELFGDEEEVNEIAMEVYHKLVEKHGIDLFPTEAQPHGNVIDFSQKKKEQPKNKVFEKLPTTLQDNPIPLNLVTAAAIGDLSALKALLPIEDKNMQDEDGRPP
ncbi:hypothetical protein J2Z37_001875 [Ammoniphilus resinae]|uniref:Uncharacterized protein n=2 Tax=Ammoniphilus resinae TaxID=861532 RepID=A0ABS4GNM4_9BACL|nr:hypothetical protein [Ammoniphilus resinae]